MWNLPLYWYVLWLKSLPFYWWMIVLHVSCLAQYLFLELYNHHLAVERRFWKTVHALRFYLVAVCRSPSVSALATPTELRSPLLLVSCNCEKSISTTKRKTEGFLSVGVHDRWIPWNANGQAIPFPQVKIQDKCKGPVITMAIFQESGFVSQWRKSIFKHSVRNGITSSRAPTASHVLFVRETCAND